MIGSEGQSGVLEMAAIDIFNQLAVCNDKQFAIKVSFLEIYNEVIRDLLSEDKKEVKIREDPLKGVFVESTEVIIREFDTIMSCVRKGLTRRAVECTAMNEASSRSHSVFK
jgi:centromeric protein E